MIDPKLKEWIDAATYEDLLREWRYAAPGSPLFVGETGDYFSQVMHLKRLEVGPEGHCQASKNVGWGGKKIN